MQNDIVLTCAVTGAGDTTGKSAHVPVTPKDIAKAAIDAAKAGASIAHIHARDPETGVGSRDPKLFKEIVDRVRDSNTDIVINITAGMGGDWISDVSDPALPGPGDRYDRSLKSGSLISKSACLKSAHLIVEH